MDRCEQCGFERAESEAPSAGTAIVQAATIMAETLSDRTADLTTRRAPQTWSPIEYGCHTRDVLLVQRERVLLARRVEGASQPLMGREERVEHDGYAAQRPGDVARQLVDAARMLANVLSRLDEKAWSRTVVYDTLRPTERSLRWVALDTWHEVHHHLKDIQQQLH